MTELERNLAIAEALEQLWSRTAELIQEDQELLDILDQDLRRQLEESKHIATLKLPVHRDTDLKVKKIHDPNFHRSRIRARRTQGANISRIVDVFDRQLKSRLLEAERKYRAHIALSTKPDLTNAERVRASRMRSSFNSEIAKIKDLFKHYYEKAYVAGVRSGGVGGYFDRPDYLSHEEKRWIRSSVNHELKYFNNMVREIQKGRPVSSMLGRISMYPKALRAVYNTGSIAATHEDTVIHWKVDHKAENCEDCLRIEKEGPYTKASLPTTPRAGATRCLSNCKCKLVYEPSDSSTVATITKKHGSRHYALRKLKGR